ncbi:50S ribosomal protein L29 [Candidatus Peregrinibacteria bacterium CG10_big_fil_rev_8_21_14_0_10_42_8]|nr:MAG: 50S ribosomal protein L29 [Candidatus Peregrinibacteria bacterium CG10_big_fil_rev_8_21_14_0_10_42_8]
MSNTTTTKELHNMTPADLQKDIRAQEHEVVKLRLGVQMGSEKDSAKYVRAKKQLARMKTALNVSQSDKNSVSSLPTEAQKAKVGRTPKQS